ncbi:hypothetical protein FR932_09950 [Moritella marina ATCC 15381]|uniref:Uncharacterized protein n=1 Tax=Moritella marina ATCC 15381 TaxID=1202962 RepID=A0A5J6WJC2_MORMI|nr:hypothetical protein [Moritella marina]QFI38143.1 hypothetical protein FR932_09950 [Moritella marina ATCC 15381]
MKNINDYTNGFSYDNVIRIYEDNSPIIKLQELDIVHVLDELIAEKIAEYSLKHSFDVLSLIQDACDERKAHIYRAHELISNNFYNSKRSEKHRNFLLAIDFSDEQIDAILPMPTRRTKLSNFIPPEGNKMWLQCLGWDEYVRWIALTCLYPMAEQELSIGYWH